MLDNNFLNMVEEIEEERNLETPSSGSNLLDTDIPDNSIINTEEGIGSELSNSSWTPTIRINPNDSGYQYPEKSSMFNIEKYNGVPLATSRRFGIVKPGDGLIILKDGILSLNVGSGFTIDEATKKIIFNSDVVFLSGRNINIRSASLGKSEISVVGDEILDKNSSNVPTSKAVDRYIDGKVGGQENIDPGIISSIQDRNIVGAINKLYENRTYIHNQISPESEWVIEHELNKRPSVTITTEDNEMVLGEVLYPSAHRVVVRFSTEFSGTAYLN